MATLLISVALAPVLAIILFIYFKDKNEKEPVKILLSCFGFGVLSVIPAVIFQHLFSYTGIENFNNILLTILYAFAIVGFSEETSKFFFLRFYAFRKKAFNEPYDGIMYSAMISMGFAALENLFYVFGSGGGINTGILRAFTAVPAHASFAIIMGYFAGKAKFVSGRARRAGLLATGLLSAILLHGAYDFFLFQKQYAFMTLMAIPVLVISVLLSLKAIKIRQTNIPVQEDQQIF